MKALSIHPFYAMEIAVGIKTVECRTWSTEYRGQLLICSTAKKLHGTIPGHALAVVDLVDVEPFTRKHLKAADMKSAEIEPGMFAWILKNPRYIEPFAVKGKLSLWECDHKITYLPMPKNEKEDDELGKKYWEPLIF